MVTCGPDSHSGAGSWVGLAWLLGIRLSVPVNINKSLIFNFLVALVFVFVIATREDHDQIAYLWSLINLALFTNQSMAFQFLPHIHEKMQKNWIFMCGTLACFLILTLLFWISTTASLTNYCFLGITNVYRNLISLITLATWRTKTHDLHWNGARYRSIFVILTLPYFIPVICYILLPILM